MAYAEKNIRKIERVVTDEVSTVRLDLTMAEARTLLAISARISGHPAKPVGGNNPSPRMHTDSIGNALKSVLSADFDEMREYDLVNDDPLYSHIDFKPYSDGDDWES